MNDFLEIGKIVNSYGIKGFFKVVPFTDDITRFDNLKNIYIEKNKKLEKKEIEEVKYHKNLVLLKIKGIDDINDTEQYKNCYLKIDRENAVKLPEDTYFITDIIGIQVFTEEGELLGNIIDVFPTGSNDVYVIKDELGKQILLPAIEEVIRKVDVIAKKMTVKLIEIELINIRDFSKDKHKKVDDTPYGGGAGMVLMPDIVYNAYKSIKDKKAKVIYLSPQGKLLNQSKVQELSKENHLILLCGHYEGIDQRVIDEIVDEEISIGDYVLTGGEIPAMVLIDSISRYVEGVLKKESTQEESFSNGLLEYPQYTRPEKFLNHEIPEILKSGHHENIDKWRKEKSLEITMVKRPDLIRKKED